MSSETAEDFEKYARDCVELARQPDMPAEVRKQLLQMAREWMQAEMAKVLENGGMEGVRDTPELVR